MTEEYIKELKKLRNEVYIKLKSNNNYEELRKECDHKNPDSSSAIEDGMFFISCRICGWDDL